MNVSFSDVKTAYMNCTHYRESHTLLSFCVYIASDIHNKSNKNPPLDTRSSGTQFKFPHKYTHTQTGVMSNERSENIRVAVYMLAVEKCLQ